MFQKQEKKKSTLNIPLILILFLLFIFIPPLFFAGLFLLFFVPDTVKKSIDFLGINDFYEKVKADIGIVNSKEKIDRKSNESIKRNQKVIYNESQVNYQKNTTLSEQKIDKNKYVKCNKSQKNSIWDDYESVIDIMNKNK